MASSEAGVWPLHPGLCEKPVRKRRGGGAPARNDVARRERGHVDPQQPAEPEHPLWENRPREQGVGQRARRPRGALRPPGRPTFTRLSAARDLRAPASSGTTRYSATRTTDERSDAPSDVAPEPAPVARRSLAVGLHPSMLARPVRPNLPCWSYAAGTGANAPGAPVRSRGGEARAPARHPDDRRRDPGHDRGRHRS